MRLAGFNPDTPVSVCADVVSAVGSGLVGQFFGNSIENTLKSEGVGVGRRIKSLLSGAEGAIAGVVGAAANGSCSPNPK